MNGNPNKPILLLLLLLALQVACDKPPEIQQYRVEKSRSDLGDIGLATNSRQPALPTSSGAPAPTRMVVGIANQPQATWFFKLTGGIEAVNQLEPEWKKLFAEIAFDDDGKPSWGAAEGWEVGPPKSMRYATLKRDADKLGPVELSISSLGPNQDLLLNVNRWLGQLGQDKIAEDELKLETMKTGGATLKIFDATGEMAGSGGMGSGMGMGMRTPAIQQPPPTEPDLVFDRPAGWDEGPTNSIVKVRLRKGSEETSPQITVTQLLAGANKWTPNAQRWARQADMDDSEEFVKETSTEVSIDGHAGNKIRLISEDESKPYGLVGIMIVRDDLAWFFKLIGDRNQVVACESDFDAFVNSFRFDKVN